MRNVMIFSGGSYPGIEVYYALKDSVVFNPIMASSYSDHSMFVTENFLDNLPFTYEDDFIEKLNVILETNRIEFIIPTHDTIAMVLADNADKLSATVVCSPRETAVLCRFKSKTYKALEGCAYIPDRYYRIDENIEYPLFCKPDDGQGAVGTKIINNSDELKLALLDSNNIICELLPGHEYTIDCFTNKEGELIFVNPRKRTRIQYGISARAESIKDDSAFIKIARDINKRIRFRGYWFIQLKKDKNGDLKLLELCTRFSGTFNHSQGYGVNLPLLALCDFAGMDAIVTRNNYNVITDKSFIDRYILDFSYDRVYIDYDDTITSNGGCDVNSMVMAFLYQCKNYKKEIVLITRHKESKNEDLIVDMSHKGISRDLFTNIIELKWEQEKTDFIDNSKKSIFIDNSFAERKKVFDMFNIPVFDITHIQCLYDWRK